MASSLTAIAGWFDLEPTPGQVGSVVILGHVDSHAGPGVFFRLPPLQIGDRVSVTLGNGTLARLVVTAVVRYSKSEVPGRLVYGSRG